MGLRDIVVILPGISGSILQKDGHDIWARSASAVGRALLSAGRNFRELDLAGDDPEREFLDDGIRATGLIAGAQIVPGLIKLSGYAALTKAIEQRFDVKRKALDDPSPGNLYEFAYDWRRDCRSNARRLERFVRMALTRWQQHTKSKEPRVILVAHSMGGLIARYFTEVRGGFRHCRALFTIGTPHRGSVDALGYLANGYSGFLPDLTEAMRTFTSVYQLLPIYKTINVDGSWTRPHEASDLPNIAQARAAAARAFHQEIEDAVAANEKEAAAAGYRTIPIVGTHQRTLQSATLAGGKLKTSRDMPLKEGEEGWSLDDGDGTVPRISAIPIELSTEWRETFLQARHAAMQTTSGFLSDLVERIAQMQVSLKNFRGAEPRPDDASKPALDLGLRDLYPTGAPVDFDVREINCAAHPLSGIVATVEAMSGEHSTAVSFVREGTEWKCRVPVLAEGIYRVTVRAKAADRVEPPPLVDIFEVGTP